MPGEKSVARGAEVHSLEVEKALREARGNLQDIHRRASEALGKLSDVSIAGLGPEELKKVVERYAEIKLMAALSSPEVVAAVEAEIAVRGRDLTPEEKSTILARVAPASLKVSLH